VRLPALVIAKGVSRILTSSLGKNIYKYMIKLIYKEKYFLKIFNGIAIFSSSTKNTIFAVY